MVNEFFIQQMEENTKFSLKYPYHIHYDKLLTDEYFNPKYPDIYHTHGFYELLQLAYKEPYALYLTEEDKKYYSPQEIEYLEKIQKVEKEKIEKGFEIVSLYLDEETLRYLKMYSFEKELTLEEGIKHLLSLLIDKTLKNKEIEGDAK